MFGKYYLVERKGDKPFIQLSKSGEGGTPPKPNPYEVDPPTPPKDPPEGTGKFTPYTDGMRKYIPEPAPGDGYQAMLEKYYFEIRKVGLDDVVTVAKNTGLTEQEVINMKKTCFSGFT